MTYGSSQTLPYKDKELGKLKKREYYQRNKIRANQWANVNREKIRKQDTVRRIRRKREAVDLMGGRCVDCGLVFPLAVYDFHHLDPAKKEFNPCNMLTKNKERFMEELKKCVLLCANCHRIRHATDEATVG